MNASIMVGTVVRDWRRRVGIVCSRATAPPQDWIDDQLNSEEIKQLGDTDWWGIMPLEGGYILVPGPMLTHLRDATYDDFLRAAESANSAGRESLVNMFPDYVNRLLEERRTASER